MSSETPPLLFAARLGSLVPVNAPARDAVKALASAGDGRCRVEIKRSNANQRRRAFYWVMLDVVAETLSDATGSAWDAETLHDAVRERLGLGEWLVTPAGTKVFKPRSTSNRSMNEADRARWTDRVATYFSRQIGCEVHELMNEARRRDGSAEAA